MCRPAASAPAHPTPASGKTSWPRAASSPRSRTASTGRRSARTPRARRPWASCASSRTRRSAAKRALPRPATAASRPPAGCASRLDRRRTRTRSAPRKAWARGWPTATAPRVSRTTPPSSTARCRGRKMPRRRSRATTTAVSHGRNNLSSSLSRPTTAKSLAWTFRRPTTTTSAATPSTPRTARTPVSTPTSRRWSNSSAWARTVASSTPGSQHRIPARTRRIPP